MIRRSSKPVQAESTSKIPHKVHWNTFRPSQAFKYALLGATDEMIADLMGININTLNLWKRVHSSFREALQRGKTRADAEVAHSLYRRAVGFWIDVEEPVVLKDGTVIVVEKRKYFPPDGTVGLKWMALRQRERWTEVTRLEATHTNINITKVDLTGFNTEELTLMRKMQILSLTENAGTN